MYLRPSAVGETLTSAYAIMKLSPGMQDNVNMSGVLKTEKLNPTQTRTSKTDTGLIAMNYMEAGHLIAAAENQGDLFKNWARFCYDPDDRNPEWQRAGKVIVDHVYSKWLTITKKRNKAETKWEDMAMLSALDARSRCIRKKGYPITEICTILGLGKKAPDHWERDHKSDFDSMGLIMDKLNATTLKPVAEYINSVLDNTGGKNYALCNT